MRVAGYCCTGKTFVLSTSNETLAQSCTNGPNQNMFPKLSQVVSTVREKRASSETQGDAVDAENEIVACKEKLAEITAEHDTATFL